MSRNETKLHANTLLFTYVNVWAVINKFLSSVTFQSTVIKTLHIDIVLTTRMVTITELKPGYNATELKLKMKLAHSKSGVVHYCC